jgi:MinD-like ATPase involved in chromosome partitioning or flagellar assembly
MMLANVAWCLASSGHKVLAVDWDLEAPGLHRYFRPFLRDPDLATSDGIIDFVLAFATASVTPARIAEEERKNWYEPYANILRYAKSLNWPFPSGGTLDFIPSGRQSTTYSARVNSFDWQGFYTRLNGGALLNMARDRMRAEYDYILLDSRTGVSDTAGICTVQMPDTLVLCFTLNNQSIDGVTAIAASVREQTSGDRRVRIVPVPMRVDLSESDRVEARREYAHRKLDPFLESSWFADYEVNWGDVEVQYIPLYSYEEVLAAFVDRPGRRLAMLPSVLQVTERVAEKVSPRPIPDAERERVRQQFALPISRSVGGAREDEFESEFVRDIKKRQTEWIISARSNSLLLSADKLRKLDSSPTDLARLQESTEFREYVTQSRQALERRHYLRSFLPAVIGMLVVVGVNIGLNIYLPLRISTSPLNMLSAALLGGMSALTVETIRTAWAGYLARSAFRYITGFISGAFLAVNIVTLLTLAEPAYTERILLVLAVVAIGAAAPLLLHPVWMRLAEYSVTSTTTR